MEEEIKLAPKLTRKWYEERIKSITSESVRKWYEENINPLSWIQVSLHAEREGYYFDQNSGLFLRKVYSDDTIKKLGYTIIDIIFPRPTDLHYHEDVDEAIKVLGGEGLIYLKDKKASFIHCKPGSEIYIPKMSSHLLCPFKDNFLEIRLACSGILNPEKEIYVEKFENFRKILQVKFPLRL